MSDEQIARRDEDVAIAPSDLLTAIAAAVTNPALDIEKMERLLAMHKEIVAEQQRIAFQSAMAQVAEDLPAIGKHGRSHHGAFARLEDVDKAIRPIISKAGFSLAFDSKALDNGKVKVILKVSHEAGYFETKEVDLPIDNSGSKNGAQAIASTIAYGRRILTKMFFNLVEEDEDTDGNNPELITAEQVKDLETAIADSKTKLPAFLELIAGVPELKDIQQRDFKRCMNALEQKKRIKQQ